MTDEFTKLYRTIKELNIIKGRISSDPTIYEFRIEKEKKKYVIRVCAEKMDSPREFRKQFQKEMFVPAARFTNSEWDTLLVRLEKKKHIIDPSEESDSVFKAREIFAKICNLTVTKLPDVSVTQGNTLYDYKDHYYFPSWKIKEIVDTHHFQISINILSSAMTELGLKKAGTDVIRIGTKTFRCWGFTPSKIKGDQ